MRRAERARLLSAARARLELESSFGLEYLPFRPSEVTRLKQERSKVQSADRRTRKARRLAALRKRVEGCRRCGLAEGRTHLVFGDGDPDAGLMFVGEAPGFHEDQQGIPFVGAAGKLLTRIIEAIGLTRDRVYIANICKCRPPRNRTPLPDEVAACFPYLEKQIEIIAPKIVVALGNLAAQTILHTADGITRLRGRFHDWHGIQVMPTFHPSYLLHNPGQKRLVWDDMRRVWRRMKELNLPVGELRRRRSPSRPS